MRYFQPVSPLEKHDYIKIYEDIVFLVQFLMAPFGYNQNLLPVMGDELAMDELLVCFRKWEEIVSRHLFSFHGCSEGLTDIKKF